MLAYVMAPMKRTVHSNRRPTDAEDLTMNTSPWIEVSPANSVNVFIEPISKDTTYSRGCLDFTKYAIF